MKFRQKFHEVFNLKPDILVISESENIERLDLSKKDYPELSDSKWIGDNQSKGLSIFTFNDFISLPKCSTKSFSFDNV